MHTEVSGMDRQSQSARERDAQLNADTCESIPIKLIAGERRRAFMAFRTTIDAIRLQTTEDELVCKYSWKYKALRLGIGFVFGPGMLFALYLTMQSRGKTFDDMIREAGYFFVIVGGSLNVICWVLFLTELVYRKHVRFDFVNREAVFTASGLAFFLYSLPFARIRSVQTDVTERERDSKTALSESNAILCYALDLVVDNGILIRVFETTNRDVVRAAEEAIEHNLKQNPTRSRGG